ncbi:hypothetical protein CRUP_003049 [Coryphaenoides rupestris]|nr:hypothetical protein CRUP_003049 [Coryphaenoides rupestris]
MWRKSTWPLKDRKVRKTPCLVTCKMETSQHEAHKTRLQVGEVPAVGSVGKGPGKCHGVNGETHDPPRTLHLVQSTRDALAHLQLWTREKRERCGLRNPCSPQGRLITTSKSPTCFTQASISIPSLIFWKGRNRNRLFLKPCAMHRVYLQACSGKIPNHYWLLGDIYMQGEEKSKSLVKEKLNKSGSAVELNQCVFATYAVIGSMILMYKLKPKKQAAVTAAEK